MVNMILYDQSIKEIEGYFLMPTFNRMWPVIQNRYSQMGFTDHLNDKDKIEEYKYICEQYRKYITSHQKQILGERTDLKKMLAIVDDLISKAPEVDTDRKVLIYYTMRDDWLIDLYNTIAAALEQREEEEDAE